MGSVGAPEILVILVVALLVLGPERLPDAARTAGRVIGELRRMSSGFQAELRDAINNPVAGPPVPPSPSAGVTPAAPPSANGHTATAAATGEQKFLWSDLPSDDASST